VRGCCFPKHALVAEIWAVREPSVPHRNRSGHHGVEVERSVRGGEPAMMPTVLPLELAIIGRVMRGAVQGEHAMTLEEFAHSGYVVGGRPVEPLENARRAADSRSVRRRTG